MPKTNTHETKLKSLLAEYDSLRQEILNFQVIQNHILNYCVIFVGAILASLAFLQGSNTSLRVLILLAGSSLLSALGLNLLHMDLSILHNSRFIKDRIAPSIRKLIGSTKDKGILGWEEESRKIYSGFTLMKALSIGKYFVPFFPALVLLISFVSEKSDGSNWLVAEKLLFPISIVPFILLTLGYLEFEKVRSQ